MAISQFLSPDPDSKDSYHYTELPKLPFPFPTAPHRSKLPSHVQKKPSIQTSYHRFKKREGGRTENRHPSCNSPGRSFPIDEHRYPDRFLNRVSPRRSPFESLPSFGICRDAGSSSSSFSLFRRGNRSKKKKRKGGRKNLHVVPPEHRNVPSDGKFERVALPPPLFFLTELHRLCFTRHCIGMEGQTGVARTKYQVASSRFATVMREEERRKEGRKEGRKASGEEA